MQILNEGNLSENALKILWLEQLPQNTKAAFVTRDENLEKLAESKKAMKYQQSRPYRNKYYHQMKFNIKSPN
ncbi:hypothetical protein GWI33_009180 [Rhynchophorus ferrugineus]|uniref:Uncharacterized protein n=1 Tax=Rhynchophorus ferrugineus TaxID=354439 RepID=A0A834IFL4_RHYFE|nr:hypothetical protein GWI33_009180 [Rhynchophorus ferrugineus]